MYVLSQLKCLQICSIPHSITFGNYFWYVYYANYIEIKVNMNYKVSFNIILKIVYSNELTQIEGAQ